MSWVAIGSAAVTVVGGILTKPKAPKAAQYAPVDIQNEQTKAVQGNLGNESSIEQLLSRSNAFTQGQASSLQEKAMPGYTHLANSLTSRATTLADHPYDVPPEVTANLERLAAEHGISGGTRGQFNDFSLLRDFGINSLQYGRENINQAQSLTGLLATIAPKVNPMSPVSMYVTPAQAIATTTNNNQTQQAIAQGANNAGTAANNASNANLWSGLTQIAGLYAGSKTGGGSSGGGGWSGGNVASGAGLASD